MKSLLLLLILISTTNLAAAEASESGMEERVEHLEDLVFDVTQQIGSEGILNTFNAENTRLGGFYHGIFSHYENDSTNQSGFDTNAIYLTLESDVSNKWNFGFGYVIGRYGSPPEVGSTGGLEQAALNVSSTNTQNVLYARATYKHSDALEVLFGRQRNPVGLISRELYPVGFLNPNLPQFLLNSGGAGTVFATSVDGLGFRGSVVPQGTENVFSYHLVSGSTTFDDQVSPLIIVNDSQTSLRLGYGLIDQSFEFGLNFLSGKRDARNISTVTTDTTTITDVVYVLNTNISREGNTYTALGADILFDHQFLQLKMEYFLSNERNQPDVETYYIQPAVHLTDKLDLFVRHDVLDADANFEVTANGTVLVNNSGGPVDLSLVENGVIDEFQLYPYLGKAVVNVIGANYKPNDNVRIRGGVGQKQYSDQGDYEYDFAYLSTTVAF